MRNFIKRTLSLLLSAAVLSGSVMMSGCGDASGETSKKVTPLTSNPAVSSVTSTDTSSATSSDTASYPSSDSSTSSRHTPLFTVPSSETSTETSVETSTDTPESSSPDPATSESEMSKQPQPEEAHFTFNKNETVEPYYTPQTANIPVPSLSEALNRFSEIENKTPEGTPEQIVQTLMERDVLCFAALQAQCWTFDSEYEENYRYSRGTAPIHSDYLKSAQQIDDLFYGTYVKSKTDFLIHYFDGSVTDAFYESNSGQLYATFSEILKTANESFSTSTYAAIKSSSANKIEFTRYYTSTPIEGAPQPNNYTFTAVKENGEWRLEEYIIDAPSYSPLFTKPLIQTARAGAPDIVNHAVKQAGNFGGEPYWSWYGFNYRIEWCAAFVSWCYAEAGMKGPFFCACNSEGIAWFKRVGQWVGPEYRDIAPGDCIFFDWDLNGAANHVGLVIGTDGERVYTIEGNRSDSCHTFAYDLDDDRIFGYGLIDWNKYN